MDGFRRSARWKGWGLMALMALMLTACAQKADFGREAPSAYDRLEEKTLTYLGEGSEISLPLTSAERDLRALASDFSGEDSTPRKGAVMVLADWIEEQVTTPTPASLAYYEALADKHRGSPVSLVNALNDDVAGDDARIDMILPVCVDVVSADRSRADGLLHSMEARAITDYEGSGAFAKMRARIGENDAVMSRTVRALASRLVGYRVALAHARLDAPVGDRLITVEGALSDMEGRVANLSECAMHHSAIVDALRSGTAS